MCYTGRVTQKRLVYRSLSDPSFREKCITPTNISIRRKNRMKTKKILSLVLAVLMVASMMAACTPKTQAPTTLVIATDKPAGIFNPLFAIEAADSTIAGYIGGECILPIDRNGELVMQGTVEGGEKRTYEGTEYAYQSMVAVEVKSTEGEGDSKKTVYSFTVKDGVKFSDGHKMNIDDLIFTWYVLADPSYNGAEMFMYSPVEGVDYYYSNIPASSYDNAAVAYDALYTQVAGNVWTNDELNALDADAKAFVEFAGKVWADEMLDVWYGYTDAASYIADASAYYGWTIPADATFEEAKLQFGIAEVLGYIFGYDDADSQSGRALIRSTYIQQKAEPGEVANISGIVKTGEMTADVTVLGSDATALYKVVRYAVLPLHHYGNEAAFDASANKFGFTKGDLSGVTAKHSNPLGAGPYTFVSNENNIVTLKANEHYFKGTPKIQYLNFRVTPVNDRINDVAGGEVDIASVDASKLNLVSFLISIHPIQIHKRIDIWRDYYTTYVVFIYGIGLHRKKSLFYFIARLKLHISSVVCVLILIPHRFQYSTQNPR
ncbi:MAG: hypothetical protein IIW30_03440 [Flavobacteriales bacterium]|nr:hypothetical protein [Flavobacteriales bacterium]